MLGAEMVYLPTDVRTSHMLLASLDMEDREDTPSMVSKLIVGDVLTVAAAFQVRDIFHQPRTDRQRWSYDDAIADVLDRSGNHFTYVHLFDLVDHSGRMLSEDECRDCFVSRESLVRALDCQGTAGEVPRPTLRWWRIALVRCETEGDCWFAYIRPQRAEQGDTQVRDRRVLHKHGKARGWR